MIDEMKRMVFVVISICVPTCMLEERDLFYSCQHVGFLIIYFITILYSIIIMII